MVLYYLWTRFDNRNRKFISKEKIQEIRRYVNSEGHLFFWTLLCVLIFYCYFFYRDNLPPSIPTKWRVQEMSVDRLDSGNLYTELLLVSENGLNGCKLNVVQPTFIRKNDTLDVYFMKSTKCLLNVDTYKILSQILWLVSFLAFLVFVGSILDVWLCNLYYCRLTEEENRV